MATSTPKISKNDRQRGLKTNFLRLSDASAATTTDYAEVICGDGAPSGAYGRAAGSTMVYLRKDASSVSAAVYITVDGGTNWVASQALDAELSALASYGLDRVLVATVDAAGGTGGATAGTLSIQLKRLDGTTNPAAARQIVVLAQSSQYQPGGQPVFTVTFASATVGSIITSSPGWALCETDAAGAFVCVPSDSADETVYFRAYTADALTDLSKSATIFSNSDDATWAA